MCCTLIRRFGDALSEFRACENHGARVEQRRKGSKDSTSLKHSHTSIYARRTRLTRSARLFRFWVVSAKSLLWTNYPSHIIFTPLARNAPIRNIIYRIAACKRLCDSPKSRSECVASRIFVRQFDEFVFRLICLCFSYFRAFRYMLLNIWPMQMRRLHTIRRRWRPK